MINVLIPAAGMSSFYENSFFPKLMYEISGRTMLERIIENYKDLHDCHFTFVFNHKDCKGFHIDDSARILTEPSSDIIVLNGETSGALCTCLMAVQTIRNEVPLIISNCDQVIDVDYNSIISYFQQKKFNAGVVTFESIHPRWSYVRILGDEVMEVAEKKPISRHAIAGFYYFEKGQDFIESAKKAIYKGHELDGKYYISSSLNEIILKGGRVGYYKIDRGNYHSFYSPEKIKEYEINLGGKNENI